MKFELSETINGCDTESVLSLLETQLRKVYGKVVRNGQSVTAKSGSVNLSFTAACSARNNGSKCILTADVEYGPSFACWIFCILGMFTGIGWFIPVGFYILQKRKMGRSALEDVFKRVKTECEFQSPSVARV